MVSDYMDNLNHRAVNCYLGLKGLTPKEIHEDMVVTLGKDVPSYSMVKKWANKFNCGRESLVEDLCPRRPVTVTAQETIAKIHHIVMTDRQNNNRSSGITYFFRLPRKPRL